MGYCNHEDGVSGKDCGPKIYAGEQTQKSDEDNKEWWWYRTG